MNKHLLSLAAILAATALIAAGCGGSDDSSDSSSDEAAPTKAAYITEADAICTADTETLDGITSELPSNDPTDPEVQDAITNEVLPVYQEQLTKLQDLTPPEGDEDTTAAIYDALDTALQAVEADPAAIGDQNTFADANSLAVDYGLKACGS